jgi:hypothetical protein
LSVAIGGMEGVMLELAVLNVDDKKNHCKEWKSLCQLWDDGSLNVTLMHWNRTAQPFAT